MIDEKGNVTEVIIVSAEPPKHFDNAVIDALKEWKFAPDGVKYIGEVEINFSNRGRAATAAGALAAHAPALNGRRRILSKVSASSVDSHLSPLPRRGPCPRRSAPPGLLTDRAK